MTTETKLKLWTAILTAVLDLAGLIVSLVVTDPIAKQIANSVIGSVTVIGGIALGGMFIDTAVKAHAAAMVQVAAINRQATREMWENPSSTTASPTVPGGTVSQVTDIKKE